MAEEWLSGHADSQKPAEGSVSGNCGWKWSTAPCESADVAGTTCQPPDGN